MTYIRRSFPVLSGWEWQGKRKSLAQLNYILSLG